MSSKRYPEEFKIEAPEPPPRKMPWVQNAHEAATLLSCVGRSTLSERQKPQ